MGKIYTRSLQFFKVILALALVLVFLPAPKASALPPVDGKGHWVNRGTVFYNGDYYTDVDTTDDIRVFTSKPSKYEGCEVTMTFPPPESITAPLNANLNAFYYRNFSEDPNLNLNSRPPTGATIVEPDGSRDTLNNKIVCNKTKSSNIAVTDLKNRRVTFIRSTDQKTVFNYKNGIVFEQAVNEPRLYVRNSENEPCKDLIFLTAAVSDDNGGDNANLWRQGEVVQESALLFAVFDGNGSRDSESYGDIRNNGKTCAIDEPPLFSNSAYAMISNLGSQNDKIEDFIAHGVNAQGQAQGGDRTDDAYVIFVGNPNDNLPQNTSGQPIQPTPATGGPIGPTCQGGALGFILCPVTSAMERFTSLVLDLIVLFLTVSPLTVDSNLYKVWDNFRNLANVAFIIAFLMIVFSQATSIGITNYGIKKLLPRLIAVAIATNLSFFICAFLVDIFNLLGAGVSTVMTAPVQGLNPEFSNGSVAGVVALLGVLLTTVIISSGGILPAVFAIILAAVSAILVAFAVLLLRQLVLIILVVIAPLAFVAALLPNTEQWFRKWLSTFLKLLMMYPLVVALFSGGALLGTIFSTIGSSGDPSSTPEAINDTVAFAAYALPLFLLPFTFGAAGGLIARAASGAKGLLDKGREGMFGGYFDRRKEQAKLRREEKGFEASQRSRWRPSYWYRGKAYANAQNTKAEMAQRKMRLEKAQAAATATRFTTDEAAARRAAGVAGEAGVPSVQAAAQSTLAKIEAQELEDAMTLLTKALRDAGLSQKQFSGATKDYLEGKAGSSVVTGATGTFDFTQNRGLMKAVLHSAATQGEISTIEAARLASPNLVDQDVVDQVIQQNTPKLMEKGGYHLATDPTLGYGRTKGNATEMDYARLLTLANASVQDITSMKTGVLDDILQSVTANPALLTRLQTDPRQVGVYAKLKQTIGTAVASTSATPALSEKMPTLQNLDTSIP